MKFSLHCPSCSRPFTNLPDRVTQVMCTSCHKHYGIVYGKLSQRSSIKEPLLFLTAKLPSVYKRHYTLQITTPDRTLKRLQFSIPGKADAVPIHYGDIISVFYTVQGYVMKQLVAITNHTTGKSYILPNPVPSPTRQVMILGTVMTGLLVAAFLSGTNVFLTALLSVLGILAYLKLTNTAQLSNPSLEDCGREGKRLVADQRLLTQKRRIEQRVDELNHDCRANQVLIDQLESLKQKMANLDQPLYSARIYRITTAIGLLKQQMTNIHRLIREYRRTLKMVEIEVETSWVADQLPDGDEFCHKIVQRLEELRSIEEENQSLKLQLSAYKEIGC